MQQPLANPPFDKQTHQRVPPPSFRQSPFGPDPHAANPHAMRRMPSMPVPPMHPPMPFPYPVRPPMPYRPPIDPNWKQRVDRSACIRKIWETLMKYQPKHKDLARRAENIEHDIIQRTTSESKYIRAVDKWTERFAAQAKKSDENKKNIDKQVNKLLNYYNSKRPLDGRLVSWDAEMAELKTLVQRVKIDQHVSKSYRRMRDLFLKYQKAYIELKKSRPTAPRPQMSPFSGQGLQGTFHTQTQPVPNNPGPVASPTPANILPPKPPSFVTPGHMYSSPGSLNRANNAMPPVSGAPSASSAATIHSKQPYPSHMMNFSSPRPPTGPMGVINPGNTAHEPNGFRAGETFAPAPFKQPGPVSHLPTTKTDSNMPKPHQPTVHAPLGLPKSATNTERPIDETTPQNPVPNSPSYQVPPPEVNQVPPPEVNPAADMASTNTTTDSAGAAAHPQTSTIPTQSPPTAVSGAATVTMGGENAPPAKPLRPKSLSFNMPDDGGLTFTPRAMSPSASAPTGPTPTDPSTQAPPRTPGDLNFDLPSPGIFAPHPFDGPINFDMDVAAEAMALARSVNTPRPSEENEANAAASLAPTPTATQPASVMI